MLMLAPQPPAAYIASGTARVPLAISSWCWGLRCAAPLGRTPRRVTAARGARVRLELRLVPVAETVRVAGAAMKATVHGREISWPATRSGGITAFVRYGRGWVIYTARLTVR
jgi:hypothetical protein